jgi:hypothetical protein
VVVTSASVDQYWRLVLNATLMLLVRAGLSGVLGGRTAISVSTRFYRPSTMVATQSQASWQLEMSDPK